MDRITQADQEPGLGVVWDGILRAVSRGLRGLWGSLPWEPTTSTGSVTTAVAQRMGTMAYVSVSIDGNASNVTISLPWRVDGDTAFAGVNCTAWALDGEQNLTLSDADSGCVATGVYRVKEGN